MSGPLTNHTFGTMQHAEYEANARKHNAPQRERKLNLNLVSKAVALIQKFQVQPTTSTNGTQLKTKTA